MVNGQPQFIYNETRSSLSDMLNPGLWLPTSRQDLEIQSLGENSRFEG